MNNPRMPLAWLWTPRRVYYHRPHPVRPTLSTHTVYIVSILAAYMVIVALGGLTLCSYLMSHPNVIAR